MTYEMLLYVSCSVMALCVVGLLICWLSDRRSAKKRRKAALPECDMGNPINAALNAVRMARPGVGEVDENGFTKLW